MTTQIAKQLSARIKAKSLSVGELEKVAGLKTHAVRNIVRGKSKRPSAEILQAVSDILGCTVKDLLTGDGIFEVQETPHQSRDDLLKEEFDHPKLLLETVNFVLQAFDQKQNTVSVRQALNCVEEIYLHSLEKKENQVDKAFGEWFIELTDR